MALLKRYRFFLGAAALVLGLTVLNRSLGLKALAITGSSLREMLLLLPPVFILLGLLDQWVPRSVMVRFMGPESGLKGIVLAFLLGSAAAGPLYGAFPVAAVLLQKGAKFTNVLILIGAWSTTKIPMLLFEAASLGPAFALTRLLVDIPGIILMAELIARLLPPEEIAAIYRQAEAGAVR